MPASPSPPAEPGRWPPHAPASRAAGVRRRVTPDAVACRSGLPARRRPCRGRKAGPLPAPGTPIRRGEAEVGEMRSGHAEGLGLALLRLPILGDEALTCGEATLMPRIPHWMRLPEKAAP